MPLRVFYNPRQSAPSDSYSPSAGKPQMVIADWLEQFRDRMEVVASDAVSRDTLALAHTRPYVDGVLDLKLKNGFGDKSAKTAASLPYTTGSILAAATHVLMNRGKPHPEFKVACSPTSGFHHAGYDQGGGYCTFNGLVVTAQALHALGLAERVAILDFDQHYGDGTDEIIRRLELPHIFHITAGNGYEQDPTLIPRLKAEVKSWIDGPMPVDIVLYQAGADAHVDDPLGGWLTTEQMTMRDQQVFEACAECGIPVVWNLAGGYQRDQNGGIEPVLALHRNTMRVCLDTYGL